MKNDCFFIYFTKINLYLGASKANLYRDVERVDRELAYGNGPT